MENCKHYVGIDISKAHLDICIADSDIHKRYPNSLSGMRTFLTLLKEYPGERVILCEATGGYEKLLVQEMNKAGLKIIVIQPRQGRAFARSMNILCKTDKIDAKVLALFCKHLGDKLHAQKVYPVQEELRDMVRRRNELVERRVQLLNRMEKISSDSQIYPSYQTEKTSVDELIKKIEKDIKSFIQAHEGLKDQYSLLISIRGIGPKVAAEILAELPEIKELTPNQLASLVGLSPMNRDSGYYKGKRRIQGGRKQVRKALYMAGVTAIKYDSSLKSFYQRLIDQGKPFKVAITAVCRKMIIMAQAVLIRETPWKPHLSD